MSDAEARAATQTRERTATRARADSYAAADDGQLNGRVERLVYSREQAAQALGISLFTLDLGASRALGGDGHFRPR